MFASCLRSLCGFLAKKPHENESTTPMNALPSSAPNPLPVYDNERGILSEDTHPTGLVVCQRYQWYFTDIYSVRGKARTWLIALGKCGKASSINGGPRDSVIVSMPLTLSLTVLIISLFCEANHHHIHHICLHLVTSILWVCAHNAIVLVLTVLLAVTAMDNHRTVRHRVCHSACLT